MEPSKEMCQEARFALHGRILRCPFGSNPPDCPLYELRNRPMEERIAWLESKAMELYHQHKACLERKLEN